MTATFISPEEASVALEHAEGTTFEKFVLTFYPAIVGADFVPLGGVHDGGADAFMGMSVAEARAANGSFLQSSVQENHRAKIRETILRLREFGRDPRRLTYVTSQLIPHVDREEELLSTETGVVVRIRERRYLIGHINTDHMTVGAFETYLRPYLRFLNIPGNIPLIGNLAQVKSPAVYVFLRQEVERRLGKSSLLEAVTDALILWALEGTDPEKKIFLTRHKVQAKIEETVPPARKFIRGVFDKRLEVLSSKGNATGREIRWYKKDDKFCLPFETRKIVEEENLADEIVRVSVIEILVNRASAIADDIVAEDAKKLADLSLRALQIAFETKGLEFAAFLGGNGDGAEEYSLADSVDKAFEQLEVPNPRYGTWKQMVLRMLRGTIYESSPQERLYLGKLCRTYLLLFSLNAEPRIVEYFQSMASDFYLYVGADILIHALSERYLRPEDRMTTHLLEMLARMGATLVLAEPVVGEVHANLATSDFEFRNHYAEIEPYVTVDLARHCSKILIRAYFYARLDPVDKQLRPAGWRSYVEQFCTYKDLHTATGQEELKDYFLNKFSMRYESRSDLQKLCEPKKLQALTEKLLPHKKKEVLAQNDALMILATYGRRSQSGERSRTTSFGYRTWWLTHEIRVRQHTHDLHRETGGHYIIRPEFLLNFIALSPTAVEVRKAYENVFPTLLGVRLSGRLRDDTFHELLAKAKESSQMEPARLGAAMASLSNQLKGDFYKRYERDTRFGVTTILGPTTN